MINFGNLTGIEAKPQGQARKHPLLLLHGWNKEYPTLAGSGQ